MAVYPRVCGGSLAEWYPRGCRRGLSPRVRGKLNVVVGAGLLPGSIPACAGEALNGTKEAPIAQVYPRVCGGSWITPLLARSIIGLSPRVRGKRWPSALTAISVGSIPACAGEAGGRVRLLAVVQVYPRVCGGSCLPADCACDFAGLSPRVRGKPNGCAPNLAGCRSIPACAGEAFQRCRLPLSAGVYPRVCGGSAAVLRPCR